MMIISQLLLALFLGYWLFSQYNEQKKILSNDLQRAYSEIEMEVVDSMLAESVINPILNDTTAFSVFMYNSTYGDSTIISSHTHSDSILSMIMQVNEAEVFSSNSSVDSKKKTHTIEISIEDSLFDENSTIKTHQIVSDTNNQLLIRGVKMFINSVGKFSGDQKNLTSYMYCSSDTFLTKKLFEEHLETNYNTFSTKWFSDNNTLPEGLFVGSNMMESYFGPAIENYRLYIIKQILSEIIFAILLLMITGLAFLMAYQSLKKQMVLISIKNDFISNISHELKTPVSTVKVALESLLDFNMKRDPNLTKEYLEMAYSETNRLDLLVNKVLKTSALEEGVNFISLEKIDLLKVLPEAIFSMQSVIKKRSAEVGFQTNKAAIFIDADSLHIHGVLVNLIDNSLKYSKENPEIDIAIFQDKTETKLTICDNGIGIEEEYIDKIFDKFFRVPTGNRHNVKGYGLGLNYATLVMQHHFGKISVKNNAKSGCTFTLIFPNNAKEN